MSNPKEKLNIVPLKNLNLTNRFLFDAVMEDAKTQQETLSIILGKEIPLLDYTESEKELRVSPHIRSVRLDIFSMDEEQNVYATEMQDSRKPDLRKRSRYYQSLMDTSLLEPGIPSYNLLNDSFLIMIITFDLFGCKRYQYTFNSQCEEVPGLKLKDGAVRIFLCTKGENEEDVSSELVEFLHYLEHTTDYVAENVKSERIRRIHERVCKVKSSEEMGVKYMQAWEERYYDRQEAREEGIKEGRLLGARDKLKEQVARKLSKGTSDAQIAEALDEDITLIRELIEEVKND